LPEETVTGLGLTTTATGEEPGEMTTAAVPDALGFDTLVAVMVAFVVEVTCGAVYMPALVIEPTLALQVTAVLVALVTRAANCCVLPEPMLAVAGVTTTPAGGGGG
jgi:hypothetical protein